MYKLSMIERLKLLNKKANATKSNFLVSAILIDNKGNEYLGANVEYEIPTNSLCAERVALVNALTTNMEMGDLKEVHILGKKRQDQDNELFTSPCGACRQAIYEASKGKAKIFLYNLNNEIKEYSIDELLPKAFSGSEV